LQEKGKEREGTHTKEFEEQEDSREKTKRKEERKKDSREGGAEAKGGDKSRRFGSREPHQSNQRKHL
jgi:hypothetical protein